MYWWEKEPLRIVEFSNPFQFKSLSLLQEAEMVKRLGGNIQHFHIMAQSATADDTAGLNEKRFFFKTILSKKKNPDRLKPYLPLAHKRGIKVIVYFNVHWYTQEFGKQHPDWLQIKENGKPIDDVYTTGTSFCVNSGYREWVFQILRDLCKYEIDGIFYDGPIFFAPTCYCEICKRLFRERTGQEIPPKSNHQHPLWRELINFQADSLNKFLSDSNSVIKKANPEILFSMNGNSNWPYWPTGRDNHRIIKNTDILGAEDGFIYGDLNQTTIYKPGITAKLLTSQSKGKPAIVFDCAGHKPWSWYSLPETELSLLLAESLAGGASYWVALSPGDSAAAKVVKEYNGFVKRNPEAFFQTESLAKIALLWPSVSTNFYSSSSAPLTDFTKEERAEGIGDISQEFLGFYEGLARAQVPFDVIDEENLEGLSGYQLLVLPNASCLSQEAIEHIKDFVEKGGNLVASFETSLYDETGKRKDNFRLSKLLGVDFIGEIVGPMNWDYVSPIPKTGSPFLKGITKKYIPASTYGIKVRATGGKNLLYFYERLKGCYEGMPEVSSQPFLTLNRFGKGKVLYLAGTFGLSLANFRFPEYLRLIKNFSSQLSQPLVAIEKAPWVEISLRKKMDKIFLHLINQTSGLKRPLTYIVPLTNLKIRLFNLKVEEGYALRANKRLKLRRSEKGISLILSYLEDYEVICLK